MKAFSAYTNELEKLVDKYVAAPDSSELLPIVEVALKNQASAMARQLICIDDLRAQGIFFTHRELANIALETIGDSITENSVVLDPACGAGDLLLTYLENYFPMFGKNSNIKRWHKQIIGRDLHSPFIRAARARLYLASSLLTKNNDEVGRNRWRSLFINLKARSGLVDIDAIQSATHIIMNPPFSHVIAPKECKWTSGKVNLSSLFVQTCVENAAPGTRITAILPDVLRSGSRYSKWRALVLDHCEISRIELYGRFDKATDVDVFVAELKVEENAASNSDPIAWGAYSKPNKTKHTVGDYFNLSIGPVVDYRTPKRGPWTPYLYTKNTPRWKIINSIKDKRRYSGRKIKPPFVVIRRNSRLGDKFRAVATIITGKQPIAVENHLIVLEPKTHTIKQCKLLLGFLKTDETNSWLNERIRCRHLTVSALSDLPWREQRA